MAVPSKGRLEEMTRKTFSSARLTIARPGGVRSYVGSIKNQPQVTVRFYPAGEIAKELILGGIDIGVKAEFYDIIGELAASGRAILLISSEMPELLALCDRILVMSEGRLTADLSRAEATQEAIMQAAVPQTRGEAA